MINQHTQTTIILNAPLTFPHTIKCFSFLEKFCHPQDMNTSFLSHVANSQEQKLTSTCCLSVKMTDKMFFFSSCLRDNTSSSRLGWVRIEILTWESWNPDIFLTSHAKDRVHYASVNKAWLCPGALRLPWHHEDLTWGSVICQWLGPDIKMSRDREIELWVSSAGTKTTKMAKI